MSETDTQHHYAPPPQVGADAPTMSTPETLSGIFFEPGRTFEALRARPRFLVATLITALAIIAFTATFFTKISYEEMIRSAIENSPRTQQMSPEERERAIAMQSKPVFKALGYVSPLVVVFIILAVGAGIYLLGVMAMGKSMSYRQALAVWAYSSLPPTLILMLANIVVVLIRPPDASEAAVAARGMVHANPSILIDRAANPVLATALGALDLFAIYGLVLAAIGLRKVARLSSGTAWTIVIVVYLIGMVLKIGVAALTGGPMA